MTTKTKVAAVSAKITDFDRFNDERIAAACLRDDLFFLLGVLEAREEQEIADRLLNMLNNHSRLRCQDWATISV